MKYIMVRNEADILFHVFILIILSFYEMPITFQREYQTNLYRILFGDDLIVVSFHEQGLIKLLALEVF